MAPDEIPKIDSWEVIWVLNEIIPTAPIQIDLQFCQLISLIKAKYSHKLLYRYRRRFGMGLLMTLEGGLGANQGFAFECLLRNFD